MQITMAQEALADGLRTVARAVPGRHVLASLAGIHLTATDNALHLQATDLEVAIACSVPASVQAPGSLLLPGRYLQELVRRLPAGPVTLQSTPSGNAARIAWDESACSVQSLPADQFPFPEAYNPEQPSRLCHRARRVAPLVHRRLPCRRGNQGDCHGHRRRCGGVQRSPST